MGKTKICIIGIRTIYRPRYPGRIGDNMLAIDDNAFGDYHKPSAKERIKYLVNKERMIHKNSEIYEEMTPEGEYAIRMRMNDNGLISERMWFIKQLNFCGVHTEPDDYES